MFKRIFFFPLLLLSFAAFSQEIKKIKITDLAKTIAETKTPLIVNFWATYCLPCMHEIPYFQETVKKYEQEGLTIIFVSLDLREAYPAKISSTAKKLKLAYPIAWLDETDADYFCPLIDKSWSGGLPSTLFINPKNNYRKFVEDELTREKFEKVVGEMMAY
jgi:thiol-disulfide isomerase/thioredoxin